MLKEMIKNIRGKWHKDLYRELEAKCKNLYRELETKYESLAEMMMFLIKQSSQSEEELSLLWDMYGSDKGSTFRKNVHTYTNTYHSLFSPIRNEVKAVFECGIFRGASLRAWRDYFRNAIIIGGDIDANSLYEDVRIHTALLDQMDPNKIELFFLHSYQVYPDKFDIIIDDGCHIYEATICLFENSIKNLKSNGIYIIEDMLEECFSKYKEYFKKYIDKNEITVEYKIMSGLNGDPHNNLIIIRKG
jgi:hypothetical protein